MNRTDLASSNGRKRMSFNEFLKSWEPIVSRHLGEQGETHLLQQMIDNLYDQYCRTGAWPNESDFEASHLAAQVADLFQSNQIEITDEDELREKVSNLSKKLSLELE